MCEVAHMVRVHTVQHTQSQVPVPPMLEKDVDQKEAWLQCLPSRGQQMSHQRNPLHTGDEAHK